MRHARTSHSYAFTWCRVRAQGAAPLSSDTGVNSVDCHELGRAANVARIIVGMPLDTDPLPPLLDATLAGLAVTGFVLSGIEYVDGCAYAQSWWCREG